MNGFQITADAYRKAIEQGKFTSAQVGRNIEIYDFLASCTQNDIYKLVDSSAFNSIIKAFCKKALESAGVDQETKDHVLDELRWIFDEMQANEVCEP